MLLDKKGACAPFLGLEPPEQGTLWVCEPCPAVLNERSEFRNRQDESLRQPLTTSPRRVKMTLSQLARSTTQPQKTPQANPERKTTQ